MTVLLTPDLCFDKSKRTDNTVVVLHVVCSAFTLTLEEFFSKGGKEVCGRTKNSEITQLKTFTVSTVLSMFLTCRMQARTSTRRHIKNLAKTIGKLYIFTCVIPRLQIVKFSHGFNNVFDM